MQGWSWRDTSKREWLAQQRRSTQQQQQMIEARKKGSCFGGRWVHFNAMCVQVNDYETNNES